MPPSAMSQVGVEQLVPLLMVASMDASLHFYLDGLGFTMTGSTAGKCGGAGWNMAARR